MGSRGSGQRLRAETEAAEATKCSSCEKKSMTSLLGRLRLLKRQWDTRTHTLCHTHTHIHKYFATLTHTHTCTPVCSVNTEIICVIKKPRTVSAPAPALASSLTIALSLSLLTGVYFWRFVASTESPESMHPSRSISIITGLSPHPRPRTRPHIFHLCVCVWAQLRFEGYRI